MAELSYFWDGTTGDGGPYDAADLAHYFRILFGSGGNYGVLHGWLDELAVTAGDGLEATVAAGAALVYGIWFESDAEETLDLEANAAQTVVVRAVWASQTVRLAVTSSALVQVPGVVYEIPLATLTTDGSGIVDGPHDARSFCQFSTAIADAVATGDWLEEASVTWAKQQNITRRFSRGAGALRPDVTNPASWSSSSSGITCDIRRNLWAMPDDSICGLWCTIRAPEDLTGPASPPYDLQIYVWLTLRYGWDYYARNMRWQMNAYVASPGGAFSAVERVMTYTHSFETLTSGLVFTDRFLLANLEVSPGDLIHLRVQRLGTDPEDTSVEDAYLFMLEFEYEAAG